MDVAMEPRRRMGQAGLIESEADIARACAALAGRDARMARIHALTGDPPLRRWRPGWPGLLRVITGQLISSTAAETIWARLCAAGLDAPGASATALRSCGLTGSKARAACGAAGFDFAALEAMPDAEARAALLALPGIGPWSADIYLMFCLGRPDVFAPGDLAMREAARLLLGLEARPSIPELAGIAAAWAPHRAVAARLLWAYYAHEKSREGVGT